MSLRLLLDEDTQAKYLVNLLRAARQDILTVHEVDLTGRSDRAVLEYAKQHNRILLTRNCGDFRALHQAQPDHAGILAIYQNADPTQNMSYQAIVSAISNLEAAGYSLKNQFVVLNQWNSDSPSQGSSNPKSAIIGKPCGVNPCPLCDLKSSC